MDISLPGFTLTFSNPSTLSSSSSGAASISGPSPTSPTTTDANGVSSSTSTSSTTPTSTYASTPTISTGTPLPIASVSSMTSSADQFTSASFTSSGMISSLYGTCITWASCTFTAPTSSPVSTFFSSSAVTVVSISSTPVTSATLSSSDAYFPLPTVTTTSPSSSHSSAISTRSTTATSTSSLLLVSTSSSQTPIAKTQTTLLLSQTVYTNVSPPWTPSTSTYTIISVLSGVNGATTLTVSASGVLSTSGSSDFSHTSPGKITAIVLGIMGAIVCAALWIFCARRRQRKLERDAALLGSTRHLGPLEGEVFDGDELEYVNSSFGSGGPPVMEERYAGILAALHTGPPAGASTEGVYGSRRERTTNEDAHSGDDIVRASSPTLPLDVLASNDNRPHIQPLSPPPAVVASLRPRTSVPPSAYVDPQMATCRRSSPGPDAAAWLGGHSIAPSCASQYARSQTMGSGSGSCSVDMLTRTHTGSDEHLLGIRRPSEVGAPAPAHTHPRGQQLPNGNRLGLGSAFGCADGSISSPSYSHDARSGSMTGSGSYGYARSGTPSSFDVLRSVSSQGALSSSYSHGHNQGFKFGFGSGSSASSGKKKQRAGFGNPQSSFRWKELGSSMRNRDGPEDTKEKDRRRSGASSVSVSGSGSVDEKRGQSSPVNGVRALLGRLRRGHTPSPMSSSRGLPTSSPRTTEDVDIEKAAAAGEDMTVTAAPGPATALSRSFVLFNPDPRTPSAHSGMRDPLPSVALGEVSSDATLYDPLDSMYPPVAPYACRTSVPSPAPTEASRLPEGLLHPRLQVEGRSVTSLRDFEDYSRPIGGLVNHRMHSTTTFGTLENGESTPALETRHELPEEAGDTDGDSADVFGTPMDRPTDSWFANESPQLPTRPSR